MGEQNNRRRPDADEQAYYKLFRDRIDHEDLLISHRLSWLLALEGALFAVWTTVFLREPHPGIGLLGTRVLASVGVTLAAAAPPGIEAAFRAFEDLRKRYHDHRPDREVEESLPPLVSPRRDHTAGKRLPRLLPLVVIGGWAVAATGVLRASVPGVFGG